MKGFTSILVVVAALVPPCSCSGPPGDLLSRSSNPSPSGCVRIPAHPSLTTNVLEGSRSPTQLHARYGGNNDKHISVLMLVSEHKSWAASDTSRVRWPEPLLFLYNTSFPGS